MNWFTNRKIGTKIITGFLLVAVIAGVIGLVGGLLAASYGWRTAFIAVGLLGLVIAPLLRLTVLVRYSVFPAMSEIILPDFQCGNFLVLIVPRSLCLRQFQLPFVNPVFVPGFLLTQ